LEILFKFEIGQKFVGSLLRDTRMVRVPVRYFFETYIRMRQSCPRGSGRFAGRVRSKIIQN